MGKCNEIRKNVEVQRIADFYDEQAIKDGFEREFGYDQYSNVLEKAIAYLTKDSSGVISRKNFDKAVKKFVGGSNMKAEKVKMVADIIAMTSSNPQLMPHIRKHINQQVVYRDSTNKAEWTENQDGERTVKLDSLPLPMLRVFRKDILRWINGGRMFKKNRGLIGNLYYEYGTPREMAKRDSSGLMSTVNSVTEVYTQDVDQWASNFMFPPEMPEARKKRDFGFNSIKISVNELAKSTGLPKDEMWRLYSDLMWKRAIITNDGNIIRHKKYTKSGPMGTFQWVEPENGFSYVDLDGNKQVLDRIPSKPKDHGNFPPIEDVKKIIGQSRYMFKQVGETVLQVLGRQNEIREKINKKAKQLGLTEWVESNFGQIIDTELEIAGLNYARLKEDGYYPIMYELFMIPTLLENARDKQSAAILAKQDEISNPSKNLTPEERNKIMEDIVNHNASILRLEEKLAFINDPNIARDPVDDMPIPSQVWYKNFKSVSNLIDVDQRITGPEVATDYLYTLSRAIHRNNAALTVIDASLDAKQRNTNENTINMAVDLYRSTFYMPNAGAQFMGMDMSADAWSSYLKSVGVNIEPRTIMNIAKGVSSLTTLTLLHGPLHGIVNFSNMPLKSQVSGTDAWFDATTEYSKNKAYWDEKASRSGVVSFTSFVENYISKSLRGSELAAAKHEIKRLKALLRDYEKTGNTEKLKQYKKRIRSIRGVRVRSVLDRAAQWAITRKVHFDENTPKYKKVLKIFDGYKLWKSIDETEQHLRTISYIMGVQLAEKKGWSKLEAEAFGVDYTIYTDFGLSHQHVGAALRGPVAGYLNKMKIWQTQRFGHDVRVYKNAIMSMVPDLYDSRGSISKKAVNGLKYSVGAGKLVYRLFSENPIFRSGHWAYHKARGDGRSRSQEVRESNPYLADAVSHFWIHGLMAAVMDYLIFAPGVSGFGGAAARKIFYGSPTFRGLTGMGSSFLSLIFNSATMAYSVMSGEDDDVDWDAHVSRFLTHSPFGVGSVMLIEAMLWAINAGDDSGKYNHLKDHRKRAITPIVGKEIYAIYDWWETERRKHASINY